MHRLHSRQCCISLTGNSLIDDARGALFPLVDVELLSASFAGLRHLKVALERLVTVICSGSTGLLRVSDTLVPPEPALLHCS